MSNIKLYSFALSPFVLKVHCYLLYLGVDFDTKFVDPMKLRTDIPTGSTVPVLTIDEESRSESSEIGFWLNEQYPAKQLVPEPLKDKIVAADNWVTQQLINHTFRDAIGYDDPVFTRLNKRLQLSKVLDQTSPNGISVIFRLLHMLFIGQSFVKDHINSTDRSRPLSELKRKLADQFESLLESGPFLCGSQQATLADLSAYPHIVKPKIVDGEDYFLPGQSVSNWVSRMEQSIPPSLAPLLSRCNKV